MPPKEIFANKGIVSVPGPKGAGDVVPAMLSPGESVIPAAMTKKYGPLISGMVNDTIPGYEDGRVGRFAGLSSTGSKASWLVAGAQMGASFMEKISNSKLAAKFGAKVASGAAEAGSGTRFNNDIQEKVDKRGRTYYVQPGKGTISKETAMQNQMDPEERKRQDKEARDARKQKLAGRAGGIGMVASTVGMGMMMSGDPGMQSAGGGVMAAGMLASVLPMLMNPIGAVVAGLVAVAGGVFLFNKALEDGSKKGYDFGKSMSITNDKLIQMSQITGRVTATEARKRRDESFMGAGESVGRKFGMNYLESESGKSILADVDAMKKQGNMSDEEIGKTVGKNLAYAVVQGAITEEEARSIAMGIGNKLQNYEIASNISANVVSILGPNGEDLTREPLKVMLEMQTESEKQLNQQFANARAGQQNPWVQALGGTAATAGAVTGATMLGVGSVAAGTTAAAGLASAAIASTSIGAANLWNPVGWAALAAGITLGTLAFVDMAKVQARNNELNAASISLAATQLQQNQGLLDSLAAQYDQKIRAKEAEIASTTNLEKRKRLEAELNTLIANRDTDTEKLQKRNSQIYQNMVNQAKSMGEENFDNAFKTNADAVYKDTPLAAFATQAKDAIDQLDQSFNKDLKIGLSLAFLSKELDPGTINFLANAALNDETISANYDLIVNQKGTAENSKLLSLLVGSGMDQKNFSTTYDFFANIKNPDVWNDSMSALKAITDMNGKYGIQIDLNTNGQQKIERVQRVITALNKLPKKITKETDLTSLGLTTEELETIKGNWELFAETDGTIKKTILIDYVAGNDPETVLKAWATDQNMDLNKIMGGQSVISPAAAKAMAQEWFINYVVAQNAKPKTTDGDGDPDPTGGAGTDPLDELLNRLKMIRQAAVNASGKMQELFKWMKPGALENKDGSIFAGVEQQLGAKGYNADFIDFISNQEEAVRSKYVSISKAGLVTLKKDGKALQDLFNALTLGEYERSVSKAVQLSKQEVNARKEILADVGRTKMSYEEVVEASRDAGLAAAIAAIRASTNIKDQNAAIRQTIDLYRQQKAAAEDAKTSEEKFNDLFSKINRKFDADRNKINLTFELRTVDSKKVVAAAQNDLNILRYQLDDYNAGLTRLEPIEEAINKKYDDRITSLENIRDLNDRIAEQKQSELDISASIARGDIVGAAVAIQKEQERQAKEAMDEKIRNLEKQREAELNKATTRVMVNGTAQMMTKEQINKRIKDLEMQIFNIEEDRLEPAQRQIEFQTELRDIALASLDAQKLKWDELKNNIELAATEALSYTELLKEAIRLSALAANDYRNPPPPANTTDPGVKKGPAKNELYAAAKVYAPGIYEQITNIAKRVGAAKTEEEKNKIRAEATPLYDQLATLATAGNLGTFDSAGRFISAGTSNTVPTGPTNPAKPTGSTNPTNPTNPAKPTGATVAAGYGSSYGRGLGTSTIPPSGAEITAYRALNAQIWELRNYISGYKGNTASNVYVSRKYDLKQAELKQAEFIAKYGTGYAMGGMVMPSPEAPPKMMAAGGFVKPSYFNLGGIARGTDTVPAMLTPGEFIMSKYAVDTYGVNTMKAINSGKMSGGSVYNSYEVNVNVRSDANPDQIARAVMGQIRQVNSQQLRGRI